MAKGDFEGSVNLKGVQQDVEVENQKDFFEVLHALYVKGRFTEEVEETSNWSGLQKTRHNVFEPLQIETESGLGGVQGCDILSSLQKIWSEIHRRNGSALLSTN